MFNINSHPEFNVIEKAHSPSDQTLTINKENDENKKNTIVKKREKKPREIWNDEYVLKKISFPEKLKESNKIKKKYKIQLAFEKNGKTHNKTVRFGDHDKSDFIEDKDVKKKQNMMGKLGNTTNPLHKNFWRYHLLNGNSDDIQKNWNSLITKFK